MAQATEGTQRRPVWAWGDVSRRIGGLLLGLFFIATAFLKADAPAMSHYAVRHMLGRAMMFDPSLPAAHWAAAIVLGFVIVVEITLGCLLLVGWRRRMVLRAALVMLLMFTAALVALALDPQAPACGCTGAIRLAENAHAENLLGLGRNAILIAAILWLGASGHAHHE